MSANGMELHCSVRGSGRDVVLLHPAGLDHTSMNAVADHLARAYRVVSVDLRGHGSSPDAPAGSRLADWAADVRATIARQCDGAAMVLGVSLGGMVAQTLACRHPEAVSALVLCGCTATFPAEVRDILRERGRAAERGGMSAVVEATLDRWFTAEARHGPLAEAARERLLNDRVSNWSATWDAIALHDMLPHLGSVSVPAMVVAGECDAATPLVATRQLAAAIPGAQWVALPNAPHMMQLESGAALNVVVTEFLESAFDRAFDRASTAPRRTSR